MSAPVPYEQELERLRGERAVVRGLMQDSVCYLDRVAQADIGFDPGTSSRTLDWLRADLRDAIRAIEMDLARSIAAPRPSASASVESRCPHDCRQRNVMLRRYFAGHPGDHITPEIFERLEALMPKAINAYAHGGFALLLNAVLQAGLDAIDAGQAAPEYSIRGVTLRLQKGST